MTINGPRSPRFIPGSPGSIRSMRSDPDDAFSTSIYSGRLGNSIRSHDSLRSLSGEQSPLIRRPPPKTITTKDVTEGIKPKLAVWIWPSLTVCLKFFKHIYEFETISWSICNFLITHPSVLFLMHCIIFVSKKVPRPSILYLVESYFNLSPQSWAWFYCWLLYSKRVAIESSK